MSEYSDRQIDVTTLADILIKCKRYDVKLRKDDMQMLNAVIDMHNPVYITAKRKSRAKECAECILRIFRISVNLDGRTKKDLKTLVSHLAFLSQDKALSSADSAKLDRKINQIIAHYKAEEEKALNDNGGKHTSSLPCGVRTALRYIDENIELLKLCSTEKHAKSDTELAKKIESTKKYFETLRGRIECLKTMDGAYSASVMPHLSAIVKLVIDSRGDIYSGNFIANLSRNAKESTFTKIDSEVDAIEALSAPKGKVKQTFEHHLKYTVDKQYETYIDYPRKKAQYEEAKTNIQNEIERLYKVVENSADTSEHLEDNKKQIQQQISQLKKQRANGEISPAAYQLKAQLLKTQWDNCISAMNIRQSNTLGYIKSILTNLTTFSNAFTSIDTFIEHASRAEFMDFIDRILKSIYSILAVLKTNNPGTSEVQKISDALDDLRKLQQENEYAAVVAKEKIEGTMSDMLNANAFDLNEDPLAGIEEFETSAVRTVRTEEEIDLDDELARPIKKPTNN